MRVNRCLLVVSSAVVVAGCASGHRTAGLGAEDAMRIAEVRPADPGWTWPQSKRKPVWDTSTESSSTDRLLVEFRTKTAHLVEIGETWNEWQDRDKKAHLDVAVYRDSSMAHEAMAAFNAFSRGWGRRLGDITRDRKVDGLGDDAWVLWVVANGMQVTYHWRRDNLVIEAHVHCYGSCPGDVDSAARAWAAVIDAEARSHS
jgi:hypothetical protein